jgi:transcriptional regulator with XRE-family HTH domain
MSNQQFGAFLHARIKDKNWTLEKLAQASNISAAHLEHLIAGNFEALPPAPYLRGYLAKLGALLDFDGEAWWQEFKEGEALKTSGAADALPKNRFKEASSAPYWVGIILILTLIYLSARFASIFGTPQLTVDYPPRGITPSDTAEIIVHGTLKDGDKLFINKEEIPLGAGGTWEKSVLLHEGLNTIEIEGRRFLGKSVKATRQVLYTPPATTTPSSL